MTDPQPGGIDLGGVDPDDVDPDGFDLDGFDLDGAWGLHPQVAVRPEPFGALLYHFGTRRLTFLKDRVLLAVVTSLSHAGCARAACAAAGLPEVPAEVRTALSRLQRTGMIVRRLS